MRNRIFATLVMGLGVLAVAALAPAASAYPPTSGYRSYYGYHRPDWHQHVTPYGVYSHYGNDPHWHYRYYAPYSRYYGGYRSYYDYARPYYYTRPYYYGFGRPYYGW